MPYSTSWALASFLAKVEGNPSLGLWIVAAFFILALIAAVRYRKGFKARAKAPGIEVEVEGTNHEPQKAEFNIEGTASANSHEITEIKKQLQESRTQQEERRIAELGRNIEKLKMQIGETDAKCSSSIARHDQKTNDNLIRIEAKWNGLLEAAQASIGEAQAAVNSLQDRVRKLEEAQKKPIPPVPIARLVVDKILWLRFRERGEYQPFCEGCEDKGKRHSITPRKEFGSYFMRCTQCDSQSRISIAQYDMYEAGNFHDLPDESGHVLAEWDPLDERENVS